MPRLRADSSISNLSLTIPRIVHLQAKLKAIQCSAPSLAVYVTSALDLAANEPTNLMRHRIWKNNCLMQLSARRQRPIKKPRKHPSGIA